MDIDSKEAGDTLAEAVISTSRRVYIANMEALDEAAKELLAQGIAADRITVRTTASGFAFAGNDLLVDGAVRWRRRWDKTGEHQYTAREEWVDLPKTEGANK